MLSLCSIPVEITNVWDLKMNKTVMIVDDEQHFHGRYAMMLKDTDYEIISVYDGDEALAKLEETRPDLIITEIVLSMMPGDTLFLYIKSMPEYEHIPVIIASDLSMRPYKSLKEIDPGLVFLEKAYLTKKVLLDEIDRKMLEDVGAKIG
jgi:CheY-like chemotaxis protein